MESATPKETPVRAAELARTLEARLGMPPVRYMTPRDTTPRPAPPTGPAVMPRNVPAAAPRKAEVRGHQGRGFGSRTGSRAVRRALLAGLLSGLVATGLGWVVAGLL